MPVTADKIAAWLDERDWPHDPKEQTKEQNLELRRELRICGARNRKQFPCGNNAHPDEGPGRCHYHGGKSPKGIGHPRYGKGKRDPVSKYIPKNLLKHYEEAMAGEVLNLSESIGALEARRRELLSTLGDYGDPSSLVDDLKAAFEKLTRAKKSYDNEKMVEAIEEIAAILEPAEALAQTWEQLLKVDDQKRKHVETETRRREKMREIITAEDALAAFRDLSMANAEAIMQCPHLTAEQRKELRREVAERFADRFGMADVSGIIQQALTAVGE